MRATKAHRKKMDRFHALIDRELGGSISRAEIDELASLRTYIGEITSPSVALMQKSFALQDQVYRESMELVGLLKADVAANAPKGAAKSAKTGGRP